MTANQYFNIKEFKGFIAKEENEELLKDFAWACSMVWDKTTEEAEERLDAQLCVMRDEILKRMEGER